MKIIQLAQVVHEIQKSFCDSIGDHSLPTWKYAPDWMKETTMDGVLMLLSNPAAAAGASHADWMNKKIAQGWVLGVIKDADLMTHPALVPFEELPVHEQTKDYLFVQTVRSLQHLGC